MMQIIPDTPVQEAIKALEIALMKAIAEEAKIQAALTALRPPQILQQAINPNALTNLQFAAQNNQACP